MYRRDLPADFRAKEDKEHKVVEGYFARFDDTYDLWDGAVEKIDRHAFDDTLDNDIVSLWNHDSGIPLGRTSNGNLDLRVDDTGLFGSIRINENDSDALNAYERIKRGDVKQCSFGFEILDEEVNRSEESTEFNIRKVRLHEVSPVTFPAYKGTSIEARKKQLEDIDKRKKQELDEKKAKLNERVNNIVKSIGA